METWWSAMATVGLAEGAPPAAFGTLREVILAELRTTDRRSLDI